jgi:hypothetical protein
MEGNPVSVEQMETMVEEGKVTKEELERIKAKQSELVEELEGIFKETRKSEKEIKDQLASLDHQVISPVVQDSISDIKERFNYEKVHRFLDEAEEDILANLGRFREREEQPPSPIPGLILPQPTESFSEYQVNVLVDNSAKEHPSSSRRRPTTGTSSAPSKGSSIAQGPGGLIFLRSRQGLS